VSDERTTIAFGGMTGEDRLTVVLVTMPKDCQAPITTVTYAGEALIRLGEEDE
jgi:hypothetical protein